MLSVIVVGAGIVGCTTALELAARGSDVALLDRGARPLQGTSRAGFGSLTPYSDPYFRGEAMEFAALGTSLYRESWIPRISQMSEAPVHLADLGLLQLCADDRDLHQARVYHGELLEQGRASELTPAQIKELEPEIDTAALAGGFLLDEPWIDLEAYLAGLERVIVSHPHISFHPGNLVKSVESLPDGVVVRAATESYSGDYAVFCTGVSPTQVLNMPEYPISWVRGDAVSLYTRNDEPLLRRHVYMHEAFITPRLNGRNLLGSTYVSEDGVPPEHDRSHTDRILLSQALHLIEVNCRVVPALAGCEIGDVWRGWRPTPSDSLPILGPLSNRPNILVATGFIGLGITMAPATALALADYMLEGKCTFPSAFDPLRFSSRSEGP